MKIDKSFIDDIGMDVCDEDIIKVIIAVASKLSLVTIAEGVETVEQLAFLSLEECDIIQGYFFSKPLSAEQITKYLHDSGELFKQQFEQLNFAVKSVKDNTGLILAANKSANK